MPPLDEIAGSYRLRFARTVGDLEDVQRLRFAVFNLELGEGLADSYRTGRDEDRFDVQCQHLMVVDRRSEETVGTYRLQVAESAHGGCGFYSAGEFDLSTLPEEIVSSSVELGRACVAREHRDKRALFLLWRGLLEYVSWNRRRFFFGCSSLTSQDTAVGRKAYRQLQELGAVHDSLLVQPLSDFDCGPASAADEELPAVVIPPLFAIYLRYGAKILGPPAIDRQFGTIDYLTMIDMAQVDPRALQNIGTRRA